MKKIGQGYQYTVWDLGNGRVLKKKSSPISQFFFVRSEQKRKGLPATWKEALRLMREVDQSARTACAYVKQLIKQDSMPSLGNPIFKNETEYEQDKVTPLREFFKTCSVDEGKRVFDRYAELVKSNWEYGFCELTFSPFGNAGLNKDGLLVQSDFGEMTCSKEEALQKIQIKRWLKATCYKTFPEGELKEYYREVLNRELTESALMTSWSRKKIATEHPKKTIIIFEGLKCAGKSLLSDLLEKRLGTSASVKVFHEDTTLLPIKFETNQQKVVDYFSNLLDNVDQSDREFFIFDRFHLTKGTIDNPEPFYPLEKRLCEHDTHLILLTIPDDAIETRLRETREHRGSGWKLNYDEASFAEEAAKDKATQKKYRAFLEKTHIKSVLEIDTGPKDWETYVAKILSFTKR